MIQLLKQIDDEVYHVVYHQEGRTLFVREGVARKEPDLNSEDMIEINEETATVRVLFKNTFAAYRQKKEWMRQKMEDGYLKSPFSQSEAMDYRADRRNIKLRLLSALLLMLCGLSTLTGLLPIPGYVPLVFLPFFYPIYIEGKTARARFYRWSGGAFMFILAGTSKDYLKPINLSFNGTVCLLSGFILLLYAIQQLKELTTKEITQHEG
ncbi:hypothetical protein QK289_08930 [Exiguobacterium antarcticum]|uniref:Uncharacterized protein n=1 Tax=Exiguobacterium antarcticum TaxID=132920 RepID=A0ABT6R2G7_9BACL|nr:hypothetical protein [Exiguobacterium antarcticum]MDI3235127.1 hypothetical protein [Exiguobacterium antarcticum]